MTSAIPPKTPGPQVRAGALVRNPKLWLVPTVLSALVALGLSLLYMGSILNPNDNLHRLPVALVDEDRGAPLPGQRENLGKQITDAIVAAGASKSDVDWQRLDSAEAQDALASGKIFGALVVPADFTASVAALTTNRATVRPTLTVLTNPGVGSLGSSLTAQINQSAAHRASLTIGKQLAASTEVPTTRLLLTDPVAVDTRVGHPIGRHSGLGLTAFYYTLLLVLGGFIGGNLVNAGVDTALGYADSEIGPWHSRHPAVPISRTQTLVLKMLMTAGISLLTTTLVMVATIAVLGMDASHLPMLWLFSYCATVAVGLGVQAINAAFGGIGQLVSMFVFIALALPSSGATVPLEATPGFYRFLGVFEPMHQLSAGVRSLLYFDARADAGLARGWIMIAVGMVLALAFGFAMTRYYDRRGLRRFAPQPT
ncbi:YhgE/Pip domain-containing protein [Streptomyces zaomyceticus]|uniref:SNG1 family protein n=1 Tax=Streptomyces zaomyceticus TaxID=68286 RepID=A0ABZ1L9F3_9ACTN|nr:SNG1 family protein [Streptomyces zaomyceticus]